MNNQRRKDLEKAIELLEKAKDIITQARDEEQEYIDNIPENLQGSERYESAENNVSILDDQEMSLDEVIAQIYDTIG